MTVAAAAAGAAITGGINAVAANNSGGGSGSSGRVRRVSRMNKDQKAAFLIHIGRVLDIDPSVLGQNKNNLMKLVQAGQFDDILSMDQFNPRVQKSVFQGDRVADLTQTQKDALTGISQADTRGIDARATLGLFEHGKAFDPANILFEDAKDVAAPTFDGFKSGVDDALPTDVQVVGEDGPEVIEADEDLQIIPNASDGSLLDRFQDLASIKKEQLIAQADPQVARGKLKAMQGNVLADAQTAGFDKKIANFDPAQGLNVAIENAKTINPNNPRDVDELSIGGGARDIAIAQNQVPAQGLTAGTLFDPTASQDIARNNMGIVGEFNPLATESNAINADPNDLLRRTGLRGLADGGALNEDEKAVVGENGPELAVPKSALHGDIQSASKSALSGQASSTINEQTSTDFINKNIVDPSRNRLFEDTLPSVAASVAGVGFLGSQRAKATQRATDLADRNVGRLSADVRLQDERARRDLNESAANRAANFVPTALNVENNPLKQQQAQADIEATRSGTARQDALLGGEIAQQGATLEGTQASTAGTEFETRKGEALLQSDVEFANAAVEQTLANIELAGANVDRLKTVAERDIAETGKLTAETEAMFREGGVSDLEIEKLKNDINQGNIDFLSSARETVAAQVQDNLSVWNTLLDAGGVEQDQNQAEIDAAYAKFQEANEELARINQEISDIFAT